MNVIEIMNTIREKASQEYQDRIPEATRTNLESIRYAMLDDENVQVANEFVSTLLNKVVKTYIHTKIFKNPLKELKKGTKPLGDTIEEVYVNFIKGDVYDPKGTNLLQRELPDVKTVYHRKNYEHRYKITISRKMLEKAFTSYDGLETFISNIINTLYNSAELDEFINMKQLFASAVNKNALVMKEISDPLESEANAKDFIKAIKTVSGLMAFPSKEWNGYLTAQTTDKKPITTFSRKNEQVLILDTATDTSVSVDVLASLFNMSVAEFNDTKKIVIDAFPATEKGTIYAALVDKAFLQVFDDFIHISKFFNGEGLYDNYFLHVHQTLAYSILVNAVVFYTPKAA